MNSMTGYGKTVAENNGKKISVELKSVNHRFLDLSIKLPKTFNFMEDTIRKTLQQNFARGHIDAYVNYENTAGEDIQLSVNEKLASEYVEIAKKLALDYDVENDFSTGSLIRTPDVIIQSVVEDDEKELLALCQNALNGAISGLKQMRAVEGVSVKEDVKQKLLIIEDNLNQIKGRAPEVVKVYREKLECRIKDALGAVAVDEARLINEVAFFSDKVSIDEEITRLTAHIQNTRDMLEQAEPIGKKLDFIVQEFNREANTIGSKCNDLAITSHVLTLKGEIEKIREQVQNVE